MFGLLVAIIYLSFISLGLPDSLLGAAWPVMQIRLAVPSSYAGIISMIVCACTIVSSLMSDRMTKKMGTGLVTAVSVAMTAVALFCFSISTQFWMLVVFAIPYGLGAGGVDASLNNYVALHLKARHMSWLHCMWGVGASISPYIMNYAITGGAGWNQGYRIVAIIQIVLSLCLFLSLPLWKKPQKVGISDKKIATGEASTKEISGGETPTVKARPLSACKIIKTKGAIACFLCFFCYCSLEQTTILWSSSYMVRHNGISAEEVAYLASLFFLGITVGRGINGFLTLKFGDRALIRAGQSIIFVGTVLILIPGVQSLTVAGFVLIGLGCAPVYPSIIHMTPSLFGEDKSQAMIGVQMASAYLGSCLAPPLFGLLSDRFTVELLPVFLLFFLVLMVVMHEIVVKKTNVKGELKRAE